MPTLFPGATWRPMPGQEKRPARRKGRGVGLHVAVYEGPSIEKINESTGNDAHLYVRFDGTVEQNIDLDLQSWAGVEGNPSMLWVETEGGVAHPDRGITVNNQPWTDAQVATLARIVRWAHDTEGTPLQLMPDSRPASRGLGCHRLGVQHSRGIGAVPGWLMPGGERWSTHIGKECPGDAKVAQLPTILTLAVTGDDDMTDEQARQLAAIYDGLYRGGPSTPGGRPLVALLGETHDRVADVYRPGDPNADPATGLVSLRQEIADAKTQAIAARAETAGLQSALSAVAAGKGVDLAAVRAAAQAGAEEALKGGVKVTVDVPGATVTAPAT